MIRLVFITGTILLLLGACTSKTIDTTDNATNDSIKKYLDLAGNDTLETKLRDIYNYKAFSLVDINKNDTLTRHYLNKISYNFLITDNRKLLTKTLKIHLQKCKEAKDTLNLARYYFYKAYDFVNIMQFDSSFYSFSKAENCYKYLNDKLGLALVNLNKSELQFKIDDYIGAEYSANKAYTYFKDSKYKRREFDNLILKGNICNSLRDFENAINNFENAMNIAKEDKLKSKSLSLIGTCLNNIGNAYREQKKYSKALYYFNLALKEKNLIKLDPVLYGFLLNNKVYCKLQQKDYSGIPDVLFKSIELLNKSQDGIKESSISYVYLSNFYLKMKDTLKANQYAEKALIIAKKSNASYYYLTALSNAGKVDSKKATKYIEEYHRINDSLLFIERNSRNQYYKIQLETNEITQQKDKAIKRNWVIGGVFGSILIIMLLLFIITRQQAKQKELQFLQEQQKGNEEIYDLMLMQKNKEQQARQSEKKRIALELHDGVMNKLASTRLNLDVLKHRKDSETVEKCLPLIDDIYQIEQEIRSITHDLSQEEFTANNAFANLITDFISTQNKTYPTQFTLEIEEAIDWNVISSSIKMNLYRIIQEATHNINKFAKAQKAVISFVADHNTICLSIRDNGKGFDTHKTTDGIGLKNIKQRVENLKGKCVIQSIKNKSTTINIAVPV